jgi:ERF superfamily protein
MPLATPQSDAALEALLERSVELARGEQPAAMPQPAAAAAVACGPVRFSAGPLDQLFTAMAAAQGEMTHATKNGENPFFDSRYADLSACMDVARPALARHGLTIIQFPQTLNGAGMVTTILGHSSGQWMASDLVLPATPPNKRKFNGRGEQAVEEAPKVPTAHSFGSAFSFGRRYAYQAVTGLASTDDDGNAASYEDAPEPPKRQPAAMRQPAGRERQPWDGRRGSHAAATEVAERKLEELRARSAEVRIVEPQPAEAPAAAAEAPVLGVKSGEILKAFKELEARLGRARYSEELATAGVSGPLKLGSIERIREFYGRLHRIAREVA